jgi:hypothetical protein
MKPHLLVVRQRGVYVASLKPSRAHVGDYESWFGTGPTAGDAIRCLSRLLLAARQPHFFIPGQFLA